MFVIAFYIFAPIPLMIARHFQEDMTGTSACIELALFITTAVVVSAFALPTVLAHAGTIAGSSLVLIYMANIINFGSLLAYFKLFNSEDMNELSLW
ncbi:hypothetical protein KIN20_028175 [Parelaphostrongylus tenuis]|uniref:Vacuolar protein sorting 55 n=1 Tax=Parelaphostrongylus tenuis TaxID=148309 RepID=A0AAD5R0F8_PARTN|nr:hypothetical protein KIN20_028175 [Parelaphostrongylus tenuis]